ncbi:disulfide bond formation protein B [Pseudomonas sp. 5P_3.1_Bac2]|uniref:disulfide bond formation protein B n=1 Tax=Pseudomonas sp. 5P_3.1_Bac2 TaxID=2971617 RepID=UPI0021C885DF|nr:disulfide bond formation protein B [Pseudomonas sp. 5P_3.1_Bac2]MCU1717117.1 disulfide bond formation protein B [Pseudomonas sp. 5P_3.1_Bac2]
MSRPQSITRLLSLISFACFAMLAAALLLQHVAGWEPCTLCVQIRLWLLCAGVSSLLIVLLETAKLRLLSLPFWLILVVASGWAVYDNTHLVLIETGLIPSTSCSPFPFYAFTLPLHEWFPDVFMSAGVCGENDYAILGISFTYWTLLSVSVLLLTVLYSAVRALRR